MDKTSVHFTSKSDLYATPIALFKELNEEFHFTLDVCATSSNAKCSRFFTKEEDGLVQPWSGIIWMNPPYGREIGNWLKKANEAAITGATVVCLVPARTDTIWWHNYVIQHEVRFIKGRLKFGDSINNAPFPSAIVIIRGLNG